MVLIRHGATENNVAKPPKLQGRRPGVGLSQEGRVQANQLAKFLSKETIAAIYSSPLQRAQETAEIIATEHQLEVQVVQEIIEADVGAWEGLDWGQIQRAHPETYRLFMADSAVDPYLGGENLSQVQQRVIPALEQLMAEHLGSTIAVVAHNVVNRAYLAHLLGLPAGKSFKIPQRNGTINIVRYRDSGEEKVKLITLNALFHFSGW